VLWLANLTGSEQTVKINGAGEGAVLIHRLDEESFAAATTDPAFFEKGGTKARKAGSLTLGPYAVARVAPARK
jgi:hypothetical protein